MKLGQKAPTFKLTADHGQTMTLRDFSQKILVLYFYPKDMTSGCTKQARDFEAKQEFFRALNVLVVGVSPDNIKRHQTFKEKETLTFSLLSDPDQEAAKAYGVWKKKSMYGRSYMGIERTTFIISPQSELWYVFPKVKVPGHAALVLDWLRNHLAHI
jgi:thioredoxin-dependent peroxiredoxin